MDSKIEGIKALSADLERKKIRYEMLGLINTKGQTPEGLLELEAEYRVAEVEYFLAKGNMKRALDLYAASENIPAPTV